MLFDESILDVAQDRHTHVVAAVVVLIVVGMGIWIFLGGLDCLEECREEQVGAALVRDGRASILIITEPLAGGASASCSHYDCGYGLDCVGRFLQRW